MFGKRNKWGNKKVEINGIIFDSKKESLRWLVLREAENNGLIKDLQRQVKFELLPAVKETYIKHLKTKDKEVEVTLQRACYYIADFTYLKDGVLVVEDVKSSPKADALDKVFLLKERMMFALKGIKIRRVYKPNEEI